MLRAALTLLLVCVGMTSCSDDKWHGLHPGLIPKRSAYYWLPGRPPITTLFPDGFRFTASPTMVGLHYLLEMKSPPRPAPDDMRKCTATGVFVVFTDSLTIDGSQRIEYPISMPCEQYHEAVGRIDYITRFGQTRRGCFDGTPTTWERIDGGTVSYFDDGNACAPSDPSIAISALLQPLLRQYGPKDLIPNQLNWYPDWNPVDSHTSGPLFPPQVQRLFDANRAREKIEHDRTIH
jgi:hypothetical protein